MKKVLYDDGSKHFLLTVDEDTYQRILITKWEWRKPFNLLVESTKYKTRELLNTQYILIWN